jgi:arylsulfatase A-like enzyme
MQILQLLILCRPCKQPVNTDALDNTIVIFNSDHGGSPIVRWNSPIARRRRWDGR